MVKCNIDDRGLIVKVIDFIVDIATKYNPTKTNPYHGEMHSYLMVRLADWFNESYTDPSEQIIKNKQYFDFVNKLITFQQNVTFNFPYIQEVNSKYRNQSIELLKKSLID